MINHCQELVPDSLASAEIHLLGLTNVGSVGFRKEEVDHKVNNPTTVSVCNNNQY